MKGKNWLTITALKQRRNSAYVCNSCAHSCLMVGCISRKFIQTVHRNREGASTKDDIFFGTEISGMGNVR